MNRVLIVGGGASGILVAINLSRLARVETSIVIADPKTFLGQGVAYGTADPAHLLNVPAGRMSAIVEEPNHFCDSLELDINAFAPRRDYAKYLLSTFVQEQLRNPMAKFEHLKDKVLSIHKGPNNTFEASFEKTPPLFVDKVVLALGQGHAITNKVLLGLLKSPSVIQDSWRQKIEPFEGTLVCLGTGLTFIDHALTHIRRSSKNRVVGISRTGLLPMPHLAKRALPIEIPASARLSPRALRTFIETSEDWRAAQDGARHIFPDIWFSWTIEQKSEFVKSDLRWWNVHRHRVSPEIHNELQESLETGQIRVLADELISVSQVSDRLELSLNSGATLQADKLINCLGYEPNGTGSLISSLIDSGLAIKGPLGWGIQTCFPRYELMNSAGEMEEGIFALGPILLGERFETTAIPELRVQAKEIAEALLMPDK
jgi:uncharacterized NAD(P)/FAD-binding protein YdhS